MRKKSNITLGPGAPSLIFMFVVLTLAVLGMLSLMTSSNDLRLSRRSTEVISAVYQLQEQAETRRAALDGILSGEGQEQLSEEQLPAEVLLEEGELRWVESDGVRMLRCAVAAEPGVPWLRHDLETTIGDNIGGWDDIDD